MRLASARKLDGIESHFDGQAARLGQRAGDRLRELRHARIGDVHRAEHVARRRAAALDAPQQAAVEALRGGGQRTKEHERRGRDTDARTGSEGCEESRGLFH